MKIETIEIAGVTSALRALHLPYNGKCDSSVENQCYVGKEQQTFSANCYANISAHDMHLLKTLRGRGDEHAKVLRGVMVWVEITAPLYFFTEMVTYEVGVIKMASTSTMHTEGKGLKGEALQQVKGSIPQSREMTRIVAFSYQTLSRVYQQRQGHRLPEWDTFLQWVETLPFFEKLIKPIDKKKIFVERACKAFCENCTIKTHPDCKNRACKYLENFTNSIQ